MKKTMIFLLPVLVVLLLACKCCPTCETVKCPDLVSTATVTWNETYKQVNVSVANIGNAAAGQFMVYVNADENPVSPNHRPQLSHTVAGLAAGSIIILPVSDFAPLAHPDNNNLGNVNGITVLTDPKNMVTECDSIGEFNNQISIAIP